MTIEGDMMNPATENDMSAETERPNYSAPALEKGLDILETLCKSEKPLSQKEIAFKIGRSVGEIYRMIACLVDRNYVSQFDDNTYIVTTKLFEIANINPPTHRLIAEATPVMNRLARDLDQSCHLTVYSQGKQIVLAKVDTPSGMGYSVRVGSELDVILSASGRVLLAFQDEKTRSLWIEESLQRRPEHRDTQLETILNSITAAGYESAPSVQTRGLYVVSFPILDTQRRALAALTVPYCERIDQTQQKKIQEVTAALGDAARYLSRQVGGH
jgi:DNA-binding IclR family transcriptional regulator